MEQKFLIPAPGGRKIPLWVMHPDGIDFTSRENILLFSLHGIGENSNSSDDTAWLDYLRANGPVKLYADVQKTYKGKNFILIAPQLSKWDAGKVTTDCRNGTWPTWYIKTVYDWAMKTYPNDPQRCALTGLSYGGGGLINFVTLNELHGKMFSSLISCCGVNGINDGWANIKNVPIAFYHAQDDITVSHWSSVQAVDAINKLNPTLKPILINPQWGGHGVWNTLYDQAATPFNMWDFILANKFIDTVIVPDNILPPVQKKSGVEIIGVPSILSVTKETTSVELDGSQSKGGKGWWEPVKLPPGAWMQSIGIAKAKVNGLKPGHWIVKFTDQDDYGATSPWKEVIIQVVETIVPKKIISYLVTPVFSDGTQAEVKTLQPGATLPI